MTRTQEAEPSNLEPPPEKKEPEPAGEDLPPPQDYTTREQRAPQAQERARGWAEPPGTETEDVFLLVPRAVLFPVNVVLKVVAVPFRAAAILVDRHHLVEHTKDILYNDERTAGVLPTLSFQSGYGFSYGVKAFHDDLFGNEEELNLGAAFGGILRQGYGMSFVGDQIAHTPLWIEARAAFDAKPAVLFYGFGNDSTSDPTPDNGPRDTAVATRFRENRILANLKLGASAGEFGDRARIGLVGLYNHRNFGAERRDFPEPSIESVYDTSQIPRFDDGSDVLELTPTFVYDSQDQEATPSRGVYLDAFGGHSVPINDYADFWHYGTMLATYVNLFHGTRVISIRCTLEGVFGKDREIPFSELVRLGGPNNLRGYKLDRFRDKVAALGTIEYRYPIHEMVAGVVFLDAGRVGKTHQEIFDRNGLEDFHYGGGLGFVFHHDDKILFKAEAAYGEGWQFFLSTDPLRTFRNRHKRL